MSAPILSPIPPILCWWCSHPEETQRAARDEERKRRTKAGAKKHVTRDTGCIRVRLARDDAAKALRIILNLSRHARLWNADRRYVRETGIAEAIETGDMRYDSDGTVAAVTPKGRRDLAELSQWLDQAARQGGYAYIGSYVYVAQKRLAARALCIRALDSLDNCDNARDHRLGRRAAHRARCILQALDDAALARSASALASANADGMAA